MRVFILIAILMCGIYITQYVVIAFAFKSIGLAALIPPFYLNWATGVPAEELCLKAREKDIDLQLAINTCVYGVLITPAVYWYLKKKQKK
jgi:hypothetical protein